MGIRSTILDRVLPRRHEPFSYGLYALSFALVSALVGIFGYWVVPVGLALYYGHAIYHRVRFGSWPD